MPQTMMKATGTFQVRSTSEPYHDGEAAQLFRSSYTKTFQGDIDATSDVDVLRAMAKGEESGGYVGLERVTGRVHGRPGSFVLQHSGAMARGDMSLSVQVVAGTGTGELRGIRGEMGITVTGGEHHYEFDYSLEE